VKFEPDSGAPSFERVSACVHCGLCLESCPTYRELRVEMDSPRGRIYLMKGVLEDRLDPTPEVLSHLDRCLDCRACETACPSGVQYSDILERTRTVLEEQRGRGWFARLLRWFVFRKLIPSRKLQRVVFKALWIQKILGLTALGRWLGRRGWLPGRLAAMAVQAPDVPFASFRDRHRKEADPVRGRLTFRARGERRRRVALFTGCLADHLFARVNEATVRALVENGCEVDVLAAEGCCGALHLHNGEREAAKDFARANVKLFNAGKYDAVVVNAAGCSAELRHYGALLEGEPGAEEFGARIRDVSEYLVEIGWRPPAAPSDAGKVAYDEPCHLLHAQKISAAPKALVAGVPGVEIVPLEDAEFCCGSAGLYSVTQPALSKKILDRKVEQIVKSGCDTVVTGNPGCLMQIRCGLREAGSKVKVMHPVELLVEAYETTDRSDEPEDA
jgi:glycolate oxidase iron-sulfur subunit